MFDVFQSILCPALWTNCVYFRIYFARLFTFHFTFLLGSYPNRAVQKLNQSHAHEESGDDLDDREEWNCLDSDRSKTKGFRLDFCALGDDSSESQVSLCSRHWDSSTQEGAQQNLVKGNVVVLNICNMLLLSSTKVDFWYLVNVCWERTPRIQQLSDLHWILCRV